MNPNQLLPDLVLMPADFLGGGVPPVPLSIKPFGALVATGVVLCGYTVLRHGARRGFDREALLSFVTWVAVSGFVLGHMLDVVFYYPGRLLEDPLSLFRLWEGLSSFGGFTGALVGGVLWTQKHRVPLLHYADIGASGFPLGWVFGRAGCTVAHDHPGLRSTSFLARPYADGRMDLGMAEMLLTIPLALAFLWLMRKPRPWGFYLGVMCTSYAPVRFALDFLRATDTPLADARYAGFTPAQWLSLGLLGLGLFHLRGMARRRGTPAAYARPELPAAFARNNAERPEA